MYLNKNIVYKRRHDLEKTLGGCYYRHPVMSKYLSRNYNDLLRDQLSTITLNVQKPTFTRICLLKM